MAIQAHRLTAWVWQATAEDRRTGFVQMTAAEFAAAGARAQDPRVGSLKLKHIVRELYVEPPPEIPLRRAAPDETEPYRRRAAASLAARTRKPGA